MVDVLVILVLLAVLAGAVHVAVTGVRRVPNGHVGLVKRRFGVRRPNDDPRVSMYGAAGPQARVLRANTAYWLPRFLYEVEYVPHTYVRNGTIGVVIAKAGRQRRPGSGLARHVECDNFQDGERFLREGGQQGRQQAVLTGGYYDINTYLFDVITVDSLDGEGSEGLVAADLEEVEVRVGETGVVITHVGAQPHRDREAVGRLVPGHEGFQLPWEFVGNGGQRGVQEETLPEGGRYAINPWFAHVVRVPSRVLVLQWSGDKKSPGNLDASLEQIVLDVQGHTVRLDMKLTLQIPAEAAPRLVRRFGDMGSGLGGRNEAAGRIPVQQFVEKELGATVAGYFRRISARYRIQEFITKYDELSTELAGEVHQALAPTGVRAVATTLEEFVCDEPEMNAMRRQIALQEEQVKLEAARLLELRAQQKNEAVLVEIQVQRLKVEEETRKLDLIKLRTLVELLGPEQVAMERILAQWVKMGVPQMISGGGDLAESLLRAMPFTQARDMLMEMARETGSSLGKGDTPPAVGPSQNGDLTTDD